MGDLVYLVLNEVERLKSTGQLKGPIHKEDIQVGHGENFELIYELLGEFLCIPMFKPSKRFFRKLERIARRYGCNATYHDSSIFETGSINIRGHAEFYKLNPAADIT